MKVTFLIALLFLVSKFDLAVLGAEKSQLIYVKGKNGRATSLLQKVVVTSGKATLANSPKDAGEPIEPWAIFFRILNDDGSTGAISGRVRVGDSAGRPIGWLGETDVTEWDTRFVLEPIDPQRDRAFEVNLTGGGTARQNATPEGKRRYALITHTPSAERGDDTEYPLVVYAGNVQGIGQQGTLMKERNDLQNVKLEVMFVIESTDFMIEKYDDRPLFDYLKSAIRETVDNIRKEERLKGAVKLGFTEYQDNVPKAKFTSRLSCDLTDDYTQFLSRLDLLSAIQMDDDWPDDVLAGLNDAVRKASWTPNSVKHVILLGSSSCQLCEKGRNPPQAGGSWRGKKEGSQGFNSTGLTIDRLIARARPQGGMDSTARTTKVFHSFFLGREVPAIDEDTAKLAARLVESDEMASDIIDIVIKKLGNEDGLKLLKRLYKYQLVKHQRELATSQYSQIARNNGEADGIYVQVEPTGAKVTEAAQFLATKLRESFVALESVREGKGLPEAATNEISQPLYTLVGAAAEKFKDKPVLTGTATVRDQRGREVAFKKVMVSDQELRRMKSTLDALFTKFKGKSSKVDRQDVGGVLNDLKEVLAEAGAGQELTADVKLKDLISDLPLRTAALDTSPADLALMTTESFKQWLERIEASVFRIEDLLTSKQDWMTLSEKAINEKFTFLRLSELP